MAGGRPTKYEGDITIEKTKQYTLNGFLEAGDVIPTKEGLAEYLGVVPSTIDNWRGTHQEFLGALESMLAKQFRLLQNLGLIGTFNSTISKLILSANHGMNETTNVAGKNLNTNVNVEPKTAEEAAKIYQDMVKK